MFNLLDIPKSMYYYHAELPSKHALKTRPSYKEIVRIFKESENNYGTCKIKKELAEFPVPMLVSHRRIGGLMNGRGLTLNYMVILCKPPKSACNEVPVKNERNIHIN